MLSCMYFQLLLDLLCWSWLYCTSSGVCVDPVGVGQAYVGGVAGNVHLNSPVSSLTERTLPRILSQSRAKIATASLPALPDIVAVHVSSVRVAVWPPTVGGLHGGVGASVTVVVPSG
jgi:hypothetical protein